MEQWGRFMDLSLKQPKDRTGSSFLQAAYPWPCIYKYLQKKYIIPIIDVVEEEPFVKHKPICNV